MHHMQVTLSFSRISFFICKISFLPALVDYIMWYVSKCQKKQFCFLFCCTLFFKHDWAYFHQESSRVPQASEIQYKEVVRRLANEGKFWHFCPVVYRTSPGLYLVFCRSKIIPSSLLFSQNPFFENLHWTTVDVKFLNCKSYLSNL